MSIQELVPSKDICEQLKQAGFPQTPDNSFELDKPKSTMFAWVEKTTLKDMKIVRTGEYRISDHWNSENPIYVAAAPLASELIERLPKYIEQYGILGIKYFEDDRATVQYGETLLNKLLKNRYGGGYLIPELAKMYLYLKSNNLL